MRADALFEGPALLMKTLGATASISAAFAVAYISTGLTGLCGGFAECGASSNTVLASAFAWIGFVGVVLAVLVALRGLRRSTTLVLVLAATAYVGWLVSLVREYGA